MLFMEVSACKYFSMDLQNIYLSFAPFLTAFRPIKYFNTDENARKIQINAFYLVFFFFVDMNTYINSYSK